MNPISPPEPQATGELPAELVEGMQARPDKLDPQRHDEIVRRVSECYRACKADQPTAPATYQPGGEWADYLAERNDVYDAMIRGDLATAGDRLRHFWRNELGPIVKEYAKFEQLAAGEEDRIERFVTNVRRNYRTWTTIYQADPAELEIPSVGDPWGLMIDGRMIAPKATRYHALSTQVAELLRGTTDSCVAEIGAGYGGFAHFLLRDTPQVTYVDFDLPETLMIAAYYLLACHPQRDFVLYGESDRSLADTIDGADVVLPNYALPRLPDRRVDVFVNTFSFSEMPLPTLQEYVGHVQRSLQGFLLLNNMDRTGVVNRGFERIPMSRYPLDHSRLQCVYRKFDLFHGHEGDYREYLYRTLEG